MHSNTQLSINITNYYARPLIPKPIVELEEDYFIEDAKAEIAIRIGQSKFRNGVLKNFDFKCALTGISETSLLTASHIIPWAHKKEYRADLSNGICLYVEYDTLFDKGFITLNNDYEILITNNISNPSKQ